ncbi:hypothetical protein [Saccharibacillus alkalitolerans]|uniref:Nucleic acid-binding protein n=1 Tax=Saccharibacillus alkalitolerans TaxID=2705290 RepID=A0ABX0FB44_9BACL|nr:hypothetical protein [Saccharibacillus alkalitolerans]NGZ77503.1 hypothetical protein [Saccharibacillus alkalitolerans]
MQCQECSGTEFNEAIQYMKVKEASKGKMALKGSEVLLTFCANCGTVAKLKLTNPDFK